MGFPALSDSRLTRISSCKPAVSISTTDDRSISNSVGGRNGIGNRPVVGGRDGYRWLAAANPSQARVAQSGKAHAPDGAQRGLARRAPPLQPGRLLRRPASRFSAKAEEELRNSVPRHEEAFMSMAIAQQTYIVESRELLRDMENALLRLEKTPQDAEAITAVFRAAHTIKGSSGAFNFEAIVEFTHAMESLLEQIRSGRTSIDSGLIALLLGCGDHVSSLLDCLAADDRKAAFGRVRETGEGLLERLNACLDTARL